MIVLSNTTEQTLQPGQVATFNTTVLRTGCNETHRLNSGVVTVRQGCFRVSFSGNVTGTAAGPVQLAIALDGSPLSETTMINSIGTAGDLENASAQTAFRSCPGCCSRLTVQNTGTVPVIIGANPSLTVTRVG